MHALSHYTKTIYILLSKQKKCIKKASKLMKQILRNNFRHQCTCLLNITTLLKISIAMVQPICSSQKPLGACYLNFNFQKNVYFLPDGKIKLHKHCQQVESSNVFISTTEASKPSIILLLMFGNSCS